MFTPSAATAQPQTAPPVSAPVRREILCIYDGREEQRPDQTRVHKFAEMPLNYLGFIVTYWDISGGLPPPERTANVYGVVTWFESIQSNNFYAWAKRQVTSGLRMIVLGEGGFALDGKSREAANSFFEAIGFHFDGEFIDLTYSTRVQYRDALIGFEQPLDPVLPGYPIVTTVRADMSAHLILQYRDGNIFSSSRIVMTGNRGGFAASRYLIYEEPYSHRTRWIIDPFGFFRKALNVPFGPVPDVTTLSGRRIYFSHIDGDGWNNLSLISAYYDAHAISAEVVLRELVMPYPDLPVSIGVIGADVDPRYGKVAEARRIAQALFELPQVEVATHTYTHPYKWPLFENDSTKTEKLLTASAETESPSTFGDRLHSVVARLFPSRPKPHAAEEDSGDNDPPRGYQQFPFDLDQETRGAVAAATALAPADKPAKLYLWSGDADPFEAAVAAVRRLGVRNMNGGDTRVDADYPSLTYVAPLARMVGAERQIYASNANDYLYITDGHGRDHGFLHLQATIAATEKPRRLKPVDVYYHMFAGERAAYLAAVRHHLDAARKSTYAPIVASQYAAIVEGFFTTEIVALGNSTWQIRNRSALQTVRFDDAASFTLDLDRSIGVIGQRRVGSTLYVALDSAHADAVVTLRPGAENPTLPFLLDSRWQFRNLDRRACGFTVTAQGYGAGQMNWGGLAAGTYRVSVRRGNAIDWETTKEVNNNALLDVTINTNAIKPVTIDVACAESDTLR